MSLKLASGSYDGTIRFWDPSTGASISNQSINLNKINGIPNCIGISDDKNRMVVGLNNCIRIYDLTKPDTFIRSFDTNFKGNVTVVGFHKQNNEIYTGCQDGYIKIFDLNKKQEVKSMKQSKPINCAVTHPSQREILTGDEGGYFRMWDTRTEKEKVSILSQNQVGIRSIAISQTAEHIVLADSKGCLHPFGQHLIKCKSIQAHDDYILNIGISANKKFLATCSADKRIKLYKISADGHKFQLNQYKVLKGHFKWVWDCRFSCDSAYLISCSTDSTIKLWDVEKGELVQTLKGHDKGVICLALNDFA